MVRMARPRQYDPEELHARTVLAARDLLEQGGPEALTARALARAVGTTPGTIYGLFENMNAVLHAVNRGAFAELARRIDALPPCPPRDQLLALADLYVSFMLERKVVWRGLFEGPRRTERLPDWYMALIDGLIDRIAAPIAGLLPPERRATEPRLLAEQLLISVHGIVALAAIDRLDLITSQRPEALARTIVDRTLAAIAAGAA
jgi:AcrR family transcriptional regulator